MIINCPLESGKTNSSFKLIGAQHMDPVPILDLVFMRHLYDAAAEIEEVVAKHPGKSPTLKIEMFDRIIPSVGLLGGIALEHVEELGCPGLTVGLEELEMI